MEADDGRPDEYRTYLLRLWRKTNCGKVVWRASLESARSEEIQYFATIEELVTFVRRLAGGEPAAEADE